MASIDLLSETTSDSGAPDSSIDSAPASTALLFRLPTHPTQVRRKLRGRTSPIWDHHSADDRNAILLNKHNKSVWRCKHCLHEYVESGGTAVIFQHLTANHTIELKTQKESQRGLTQANIKAVFDQVAQSTDHKRRRLDSTNSRETLDPAILERLYVRWTTSCNIAFRNVESIHFRAFVNYLNPEVDTWLPSSHSSIQNWTIRAYSSEKQLIETAIQSALSKIHLTVDLWTSPNSLAILGVVAHYISDSGQLEHTVLALRELAGEHSGENQAAVLIAIIQTSLSASLSAEYSIDWDPLHHRLRCNGHIVNLAAQAFLFPSATTEALTTVNSSQELLPPTEEEVVKWRNQGPLGKLHNIVVYIKRSPQRLAQFKALSNGLGLIRDNSTRWNSWYSMVERALRVRDAIDLYCLKYKDNEDDYLSPQDWLELEKLASFLVYFQDATLAAESRFATIDSTLPIMDFLLEKVEDAKLKYTDDIYMGPCCNAGWAKLDKYYSLTDRSSVYTTALVLCPQWKWTYFESNWPAEWVTTAKESVQDLWNSQYRPVINTIANQEPTIVKSHYLKWRADKKGNQGLQQDEYQQYLHSPVIEVSDTDPCSWWLEPTQRKLYPSLSLMALDILSIPAMSAEPERLFSSTKISISDLRHRLGIRSVEAIQCVNSWINKGRITWVDDEIVGGIRGAELGFE